MRENEHPDEIVQSTDGTCSSLSFGRSLSLGRRVPTRRTLSRQTVAIHPSSVLFHSKPSCIVFTELIQTGKRYVRQVTLIDQDWIEELPKDTLLQLRQVQDIVVG